MRKTTKKKSAEPKIPMWRYYRLANHTFFKVNPVLYILCLCTNFLYLASALVRILQAPFLVDAAYRLVTGTSEGFGVELRTAILFGVANVTLALLTNVQRILIDKLCMQVHHRIDGDLQKKLGRIDWECLETHNTHIQLNDIDKHMWNSFTDMFWLTDSILWSVLQIVAYTFFLSQINPIVVVLFAVFSIFGGFLADKGIHKTRKLWDETRPIVHKEDYFFGLSGDRITHQEYKCNRMLSFVGRNWSKHYKEEQDLRLRIFRKEEVVKQSWRLALNVPYGLTLGWVAYEITLGLHTVGFFALCMNMLDQISGIFINLQYWLTQARISSKFLKSYYDVLTLPEEPEVDPSAPPVKQSVTLSHVTYTYPQAEFKALDDLSLTLRHGEKVAIVGHNGSGKTTCTNLLTALTGRFDGVLTADGDPDAFSRLRQSVAIISQDFTQYQTTVRDNIALGNIGHTFTDDELWTLLEQVGLDEAVRALPNGLDEKLGQLDEGIELSKGQWQRIAIARLLANPDATIWILDEPTAYLDPLSEIEIYNTIYALAGDRTVLFISHRLGFAKRADRIVVFDHGRLAEEGTHHDLMEIDGIYAEMYRQQESWYAA